MRRLPIPSRLRTGVREARAEKRANEERKREEEARAKERENEERKREEGPPGKETPAVPTDRPGTKGMEDGRNGGEEETVAGEGKEVAKGPKKGRQ